MTLDELIKQLHEIQQFCGDIDVVIVDGETGWADDLDNVEVEEHESSIRVALSSEIAVVLSGGNHNDPR